MARRAWLIVGGCGVLVVGAALVAYLWWGRTERGRPIVFQAKVNGLYQLFTIRPDGSGLKQLTHVEISDSGVPGVDQPHWSPDGKLILFGSDYERTRRHIISLFTIRTNGSGLKRLPIATGMFDGEGSWSPDGTNIVYTYDASDIPAHAQGINIARADGAFPYALTRVGYPYELHGRPTWSPNGKWIAFVENYGRGQSVIMKVGLAGNPVPLTLRDLNGGNPKWSPDGTKILFNSHWDDPRQNSNLYTVSRNGKHLRQLTHYRGGLDAIANSWSPDGTEILYHLRGTRPDGSNVNQLFILDPSSGQRRQLTHLPAGMDPGYADWH